MPLEAIYSMAYGMNAHCPVAEDHVARRLVFLTILGLASSAWSQATNYSWEVYAQPSLTNTNLIFGDSAGGVRLGTTWKPVPSFGLVADVGRSSGAGPASTYA
jgi:hypothetical protein